VTCDWIQYKQAFREPVVARPIAGTDTEMAFDLRRCADMDMAAKVKRGLDDYAGLTLEPRARHLLPGLAGGSCLGPGPLSVIAMGGPAGQHRARHDAAGIG
jgi:hypothetical protein